MGWYDSVEPGSNLGVARSMAAQTFPQSYQSVHGRSAGVSGKPPWWLSRCRMVTDCFPFWPNSGQYLATGSSQFSLPRSLSM